MKELSIEQKAQRYDEALTKARNIVNSINVGLIGKDSFEAVFPELKESEDEKIRKNLIGYIKGISKNEVCEETKDSWIAWLEKQGEQSLAWSEEDNNMLKWVIGYLNNRMLNTPISEERAACKNAIAWLEKQGEQKPTDKVEPKFKVGDWVVRGKTIAQILDIQEQYYIGLDIDGNDFTSSRFLNDDKIHLWTIQDAKDGDVLVSSYSQPFLFKEVVCDELGKVCCAYGGIDGSIKFIANTHEKKFWTDSEGVEIATKEQCDALMKAMTDAGYTFDFEKKELKKIEQKPTWSEEDERIYQSIMDDTVQENQLDGKQTDWLRDIKYRYFPQLKQKWSEEDEKILNSLISSLARIGASTRTDSTSINYTFSKEIDWLKSLRPQNRWKPSDEQMKLLKELVEDNNQRYFYPLLRSLYEQLKKLKGE